MKVLSYLLLAMLLFQSMGCAQSAGLSNALDISTSAIVAHKTKMNVHAQNIANVDTTETADGGPYRSKTVVMKTREFITGGGRNIGGALGGVQVAAVVDDTKTPLVKVYDPTHPNADEQGYVYFPNVNMTEELVDMSSTSGAFETNVIVFNTTKQMMQTALELGR